MSRIRRLGFAAIMMVAMLVGGAPAFATEPLTTSGHVTDPDSFLSDEQRETIETPAKSFYSTYTTYIDVAVIPNFSGQKPLAWCEDTLEKSRTKGKGILYVVAYEDGTNVSCAGSELAKDSMTRLMLDGAREYDYAEPPTVDEDTEPTPIVDTVRRDALRAAAEARRRLSEAEEQVRAAEEDWNFARAQFGSAAAEEYGRRLEAAKEAISRGFDTYKQIEQTSDSHAKRRLATTITEDLDKNLPPLQDASKEFAAQREKRSSLPAQLADARERLVEELADLERSKEELSSIAGLYTESMLASLQDNPQRAAQLLESARAALETASAHIDTDATRAASALDTAQRALTMANAQTDAIFSAKTDLDGFRERLTASIGSVSAALSDAKQLDSSDAFSPLLDEAEAAIARGQRALVSDEDPLGALENLRDVELRLEAVLAPLMTQEQAKRKAKETAQRHIRDADAALTWARRYLKGHEGSALLDVNKLMHEAEQAMTEAREVLDEDPLRASAAASRATTLTNRALAAPGRR